MIALDDREPTASASRFLGGTQLAAILSGPAAVHTTAARGPEEAAYIVWASGSAGEPQGWRPARQR